MTAKLIHLDEGYMFGLGAFETIAVESNHCVLLKEHLSRLQKAIKFFQIRQKVTEQEVFQYLENRLMEHSVLKIMVSAKNIIFTTRQNPYGEEHFQKGFTLGFSDVRRNETSPLTYHKTFHYGDCLMEKRAAQEKGWDEPVFLNTKGEISEGATTNIFFVKDGIIVTPPIFSGLLNGILRQYVLSRENVVERIILADEVPTFDECFITNSLMGIMPVRQFGKTLFPERTVATRLHERYRQEKVTI
ncbi:MAG TPA: aminotransferase class IV [Firmicutes bacterium]|nr:aminotransferase class IV [Bacillota bacterium]